MKSLQVFSNTEFGILGVLTIDGKEMFPATECARLLGYADPYDAVKRHTKGSVKHRVLTPGGEQQINFITEGDLYRLIVHSKLPSAERFERWVFDEVLPSVRRHGLYAVDELLADPDLWIKALQELKAERAKNAALTATVSVQRQQIAEMKPKASYYDVVLNCKDAVAITTIAKDYGKSGRWLNEYLHSLGVQFRQGNIWLLYQKYARHGYTVTKTHSYPGSDGEIHAKVHTYWTQKGRLFIYELLKSQGCLPLIEQGLEFEQV
ncbi:MAG: phage antirepressor KilAC domain-containing protein [Clostridium sp.]|nr:phage antirepressor KilAC domain-containing protein [Clostridium sp.]